MGLTSPAISQWPMVVSLPLLRSCRRANAPEGAFTGVPQPTPSMLNSPSWVRLGAAKAGLPDTERRVFTPWSPNLAASGSSPMPKLSRTIKNTRFAILLQAPFASGRRADGQEGSWPGQLNGRLFLYLLYRILSKIKMFLYNLPMNKMHETTMIDFLQSSSIFYTCPAEGSVYNKCGISRRQAV